MAVIRAGHTVAELKEIARQLRIDVIEMICQAQYTATLHAEQIALEAEKICRHG